jgi:Trk K+ transport system NAD-binding subunit
MIGAIQRDGNAKVPGAEDTIARGDQLLIIGPHGIERQLKKLFVTK